MSFSIMEGQASSGNTSFLSICIFRLKRKSRRNSRIARTIMTMFFKAIITSTGVKIEFELYGNHDGIMACCNMTARRKFTHKGVLSSRHIFIACRPPMKILYFLRRSARMYKFDIKFGSARLSKAASVFSYGNSLSTFSWQGDTSRI